MDEILLLGRYLVAGLVGGVLCHRAARIISEEAGRPAAQALLLIASALGAVLVLGAIAMREAWPALAALAVVAVPLLAPRTLIRVTGGPDPLGRVRREAAAVAKALGASVLGDDQRAALRKRRASIERSRSDVTADVLDALDQLIRARFRGPRLDPIAIESGSRELQAALRRLAAS